LRANTTVVPADVAYPTDSEPAKAVAPARYDGPVTAGRRRGGPHPARDRSRAACARAREVGAKLRLRAAQSRDEAHPTVRREAGELAGPPSSPHTVIAGPPRDRAGSADAT